MTTRWERRIAELGIEEYQALACPALRKWAEKNAQVHYVPEHLLSAWGIRVDETTLYASRESDLPRYRWENER